MSTEISHQLMTNLRDWADIPVRTKYYSPRAALSFTDTKAQNVVCGLFQHAHHKCTQWSEAPASPFSAAASAPPQVRWETTSQLHSLKSFLLYIFLPVFLVKFSRFGALGKICSQRLLRPPPHAEQFIFDTKSDCR